MVKRHLGISIDEWDQLPWWKQRVYLEGILEEFTGESSEGQAQEPQTRVFDLDEDGPEALAQFGVSIQAV